MKRLVLVAVLVALVFGFGGAGATFLFLKEEDSSWSNAACGDAMMRLNELQKECTRALTQIEAAIGLEGGTVPSREGVCNAAVTLQIEVADNCP